MAGGQATTSGIEYQQRVAAWCMIVQYSNFDISIFFDQLDEKLTIEGIQFESSDAIDDLVLNCTNSTKLMLQIKRSISLSAKEGSDFHKTIVQFVRQFSKEEKTRNYFGLITTPDASSKITSDLKKITASLRISEDALITNPLNESEKDTLEKVETIFLSNYEIIAGRSATKEKFRSFLKRVFVSIIDIQAGRSMEVAAFMLLQGIGFSKPELMWSVLIKNSLVYGANRFSIDKKRLKEIFDKYLNDEKKHEKEEIEVLKTEIIAEGEYPVGKEVLFIESFVENADYLIVELHRFEDDCVIKNKFYSNKIRINNGDEWTIIQRFATMDAIERFSDQIADIVKDKKLVITPARGIGNVEETECAKLHKAYLNSLLKKNNNFILCLHCGKAVDDSNSQYVELQDSDTVPSVGLVHLKCMRPIDRILGTIEIPNKRSNKHLDLFDFKLWVELRMKGQALLEGLRQSVQGIDGRNPVIAWSANEEYDPEYSFCIKFNLEDGSSSYPRNRGRIQRVNKSQAEEHLEVCNKSRQLHYQKNDPLCVLSVSRMTLPYSEALKFRKPEERVLEIKTVEIVRYSKQIAKVFDQDVTFYTPLCLVRDSESEELCKLVNVVPVISNPMHINEFYENWSQLGFTLNEIELKILKTDSDFDYNMRKFFAEGLSPIVDPIFDKNFNLVKGYPIIDHDKWLEENKEHGKESDGL